MKAASREPAPGHYRTARSIALTGAYAICDYPLRVVRPGETAMRLLALCQEQHTCAELARLTSLPMRRVEMLCEQLQWKGLLEAGPLLPPTDWPGVSIIIPSHNRAQQLERCLRSLCQVEYPATCLEIIVVDDASSDETSSMLQRVSTEAATHGRAIRIVRHARRQGVARGRNSGAEIAQYELLAFIDSDCVASPEWLIDLVPAFQNQQTGAVGGMIRAYKREHMLVQYPETDQKNEKKLGHLPPLIAPFGTSHSTRMNPQRSSGFALGRYEDVRSSLYMGKQAQQVRLEGPLTYLPTANLLVHRTLWQQIGGFEPLTFGEDVDFCRRLLAGGTRILYLPRGVVYHDYRTSWWGFLHIRVSYASSEAALLQRHPTERRVLLLPPEQATFAGLAVGGMWNAFLAFLALLVILVGTRKRLRKVRKLGINIHPLRVFRATIRGHLAYTYHLCRHLTRYYTLLLLFSGVLLPPLLVLLLVMDGIVIGVDYVRLRPALSIGQYAPCSLLDDCAYEVGVVLGCIRQRTWKPLLPVIRKKG